MKLLFTDSFSSNSIWWHQLIITYPRVIRRTKVAFLFVDHGSSNDLYVYFMRKKDLSD